MNTRSIIPTLIAVLCTGASCAAGPSSPAHSFAIGTNDFLLDGKPFQIRCGEMHAARVPREYWRHRLQMARAMGLNAVCAYLFWNVHEPSPGHFDWSGQADAAAFCRLAQQEGLWVILRPGPYSCAEWEMGGLPWWLLKQPDIRVRTRDPRYLDPARRYLREVGRVLGPLQVTRGGPILMVQAENEYGSFGKDAEYMGAVRQALLDAGFTVPLFACDPPKDLENGYRPDLFPVVNFGSDPAGAFKSLRGILPQGPLMCGEFYPGWFDTWGAPHHTGKTDAYLRDLEYMLTNNASFSIYMAHGGTTFGLWAGCDRPFKPDVSSYDYDAPISEAGWATGKFFSTLALFTQHLSPGETLPELPARNPVIAIPRFELKECAPVLANLPKPITDERPRPVEIYNQGYGCILYRTTLPSGPAGRLDPAAIHDFGYVFLDGQRIGIADRRSTNCVQVPARMKAATLDVLVEPMGRLNFGPHLGDHKGIVGPLNFTAADSPRHPDASTASEPMQTPSPALKGALSPSEGEREGVRGRTPVPGSVAVQASGSGPLGLATELTGWQVFNLPLDAKMLRRLRFGPAASAGPAFWRGEFRIARPGDTFLDLRSWGKGVVWINGHCLCRFWNIGPTQTAYVPGPWLHRGRNEVLVLDLLGPEKPELSGLEQPILDQVRPELDFTRVDAK